MRCQICGGLTSDRFDYCPGCGAALGPVTLIQVPVRVRMPATTVSEEPSSWWSNTLLLALIVSAGIAVVALVVLALVLFAYFKPR